MAAFTVDHDHACAAFLNELDLFVAAAESLEDVAFLGASRCHGWSRLDVVVHVRTGLQEMLGGVMASTSRPVDTDAASYWVDFAAAAADQDEVDAILWTRRTASAYRRPSGALEHLHMVAAGLRAAVAAMPTGAVEFQGGVLSSGDLLATWAVELAVHHLDLALPSGTRVALPTPESLTLARTTVERCADAVLPESWADDRVVLLGTGRQEATADEHNGCAAVERFPVL